MKCPRLSTLAGWFVEKVGAPGKILHIFPAFYIQRTASAPVLPKLFGGMVFSFSAARYNKSVPER